MPPRWVNISANRANKGASSGNETANPRECDRNLTPPVWPYRENVLDESFEPLVQAMIEAFQRVTGTNATLISRGLPLKRLPALGGKEFSGVRGADPTKAKYWLEGVEKILEQMACTEEEKLGCSMSLLTSEVATPKTRHCRPLEFRGFSDHFSLFKFSYLVIIKS